MMKRILFMAVLCLFVAQPIVHGTTPHYMPEKSTNDDWILFVPNQGEITELFLNGYYNMTGENLFLFKNLLRLQLMDMSRILDHPIKKHKSIFEEKYLAGLKKLKTLSIVNSEVITGKYFDQLEDLRMLSLYMDDYSHPLLTDEHLSKLKNLKKLELLELTGCEHLKWFYNGQSYLDNIPSLKYVYGAYVLPQQVKDKLKAKGVELNNGSIPDPNGMERKYMNQP